MALAALANVYPWFNLGEIWGVAGHRSSAVRQCVFRGGISCICWPRNSSTPWSSSGDACTARLVKMGPETSAMPVCNVQACMYAIYRFCKKKRSLFILSRIVQRCPCRVVGKCREFGARGNLTLTSRDDMDSEVPDRALWEEIVPHLEETN